MKTTINDDETHSLRWIDDLSEKENKIYKQELGIWTNPETHNEYLYYGFITAKKKNGIVTDMTGRDLLLDETTYTYEINDKGKSHRVPNGKDKIKTLLGEYIPIGTIANTIQPYSVKKWIKKKPNITPQHTYQTIAKQINKFMDLPEDVLELQVCWVIATYLYPIFEWFPHLLLTAPSGSGKTQNLNTLLQLSYRGYMLDSSGNPTPATIYRTLEGNQGTVGFDEMEQSDKLTEGEKLINQILNSSAGRRAYVTRLERNEQTNKWEAKKFNIFCPKIAANISGVNSTSLSRFIPINLLRTKGKKGNTNPERYKEEEGFEQCRETAYFLMLGHWKELRDIYEGMRTVEGLRNRDADNFRPLLSVAQWISPEVYQAVLQYASTYQEIQKNQSDSNESMLLALLERAPEEPAYIKGYDLALWSGDLFEYAKSPERIIGKRLRQYKIDVRRTRKGMEYRISYNILKDILERYFPSFGVVSVGSVGKQMADNNTPNYTEETVMSEKDYIMKTTTHTTLKLPTTLPTQTTHIKNIIILLNTYAKTSKKFLTTDEISQGLHTPSGNISELVDTLKDLAKKGDIIEVKPDCWMILV